jgi:hypothetical protein
MALGEKVYQWGHSGKALLASRVWWKKFFEDASPIIDCFEQHFLVAIVPAT